MVPDQRTDQGTRSPIELFWTANNDKDKDKMFTELFRSRRTLLTWSSPFDERNWLNLLRVLVCFSFYLLRKDKDKEKERIFPENWLVASSVKGGFVCLFLPTEARRTGVQGNYGCL